MTPDIQRRMELQEENAALRAEVEEARAESAALRKANDTRIDDFLNEMICCNGVECGCQGATRLQELVWQEAGRQLGELRAEVERLKAALHSSCDDERSMTISEGVGHTTCGLADELTKRAERAEADTARLDWLDAEHHTKNSLPIAALVVKVNYKRDSSEWANVCGDIRAAIDAARAALGGTTK